MLDFDLTEEQRLLEQSVREWGAREVAPRIRELDRQHRFDPAIVPQMADLGLLGCSVPQEYGGAGMDYVSLGLISEELEYVDTSLRVIMSVHVGLNCLSLLAWGTEDQKQRYLVPQAQGRKLATYGLTEPSAGSDVRGIQTVAVKKGDRYFLTGEKMWISLADVADNFLVFAWSDLEKKKQRDPSGLSAFIIERGFKGFSSGTLKEKWGILAGNTGFFKMEDVEVPEANVVGKPGEGFKIAMFALDQGRYTVAAGATGLIRACRDASSSYAKERQTFGVAIAEHQLVKEMIAQMESDYQVSRLLYLRSGFLKNQGRRNTRETGLAKWFSTVASERAAGDAVQVHGANGYSDEYPVGRFYRNCKGAVIYEGTREIHKLMQADYVLGFREDRPTRCELPKFEPSSEPSSEADELGSFPRIPPRRRAGGDRLCAHDGAGRWPQVRPGGRRDDARRCSIRCRSTERSSSAKASATRRRCSTSARLSDSPRIRSGRFSGCRKSTSPSIRSRGRTCARPERPTRSPFWRRRIAADCCMRQTSTWKSSSSGRARRTSVSLDAPVAENLRAIARCLDRDVTDLVVIVLDRPRHEQLIAEIRATGARIRLISDGDLSAGIAAAVVGSGVHAVMGTGGAPEGVITAAAMRCLNGEIFARLVVNTPEHEARCRAMGIEDFQQDLHIQRPGVGRQPDLRGHGRDGRCAAQGRPVLRRRHADALARHADQPGPRQVHRHDPRRAGTRRTRAVLARR